MSLPLTASANQTVRLWSAPLRPDQSMAKMRAPCSVGHTASKDLGDEIAGFVRCLVEDRFEMIFDGVGGQVQLCPDRWWLPPRTSSATSASRCVSPSELRIRGALRLGWAGSMITAMSSTVPCR